MNKKLFILLFCIALITTTFLAIKYIKNNKDDNYQEIAQNKESETESDQEKENLPIVTKNNQKGSYWPKIILAIIIFVVTITLIFIVYLIKNSPSKKKFDINANKKINLTDKNVRQKIIDKSQDYSIKNQFRYSQKYKQEPHEYDARPPFFLSYHMETDTLIFTKYDQFGHLFYYFQCSNDQIRLDDNYLLLFALLPIENHFFFVWENIEYRKFVQEKLRQLSAIFSIFDIDNKLKNIIETLFGQNNSYFLLLTNFDEFSYSPTKPNNAFFQLCKQEELKYFNDYLEILKKDLNAGRIGGIFEYATCILKDYYDNNILKIPCFEDNSTVPFKNLIVLLGIFEKIFRLSSILYDENGETMRNQLLTEDQKNIVNKIMKVCLVYKKAHFHIRQPNYVFPPVPYING